jgi:2-aminoadipate transaminase
MNFENLLADRTNNMQASIIRELLKVTSQPGMISMAGGLPAPESFPMSIIEDLFSRVIKKHSSGAFQYGPSEGFTPFREVLVGYLQKNGINTSVGSITIASGSQGVLDSLGKILISKGDCVAVEAPTYVGALSAFNAYEPKYVALDTDDDGLIPESLERVLRNGRIKFVYLIPTFQNPTGRTIPLQRRKEIADIIKQHNALLVEDDPYGALRYRGKHVPPIWTFAPDNIIYTTTLSKVFAPGLRLGACVAPESIHKWMVLAKQGVDLHTATLNQALAAEYIGEGYLDRHLPKIIELYRPKQKAMLDALEKYFPDGFKWSKPEGGMFIWAEGPEGLDTDKLYWKAIEKKVAYVPGQYFYINSGQGAETMRLNYTMSDEETLDRGIRILSEVIKDEL